MLAKKNRFFGEAQFSITPKRHESAIQIQSGRLLMKSTAKKVRASPRKRERQIIREGIDEESRKYLMEVGGSCETHSRIPLNVTLEDVPLEDRRREAKKPLYLTRYE